MALQDIRSGNSAMQDLDNQVQSLDVCIAEQKAAA